MTETKLITLNHDHWNVVLAPEIGGSIALCQYKGQNMLRPASQEALDKKDVLGMSSFPLVPFSNRINKGKFNFQGREIKLSPNMGDHPHPLHGDGWLNPWLELPLNSESVAMLQYYHPAGEWPWDYTALQTFSIEENVLKVKMEVTNNSKENMPAGLGPHPYLPRPPGTRMKGHLPLMWEATNQQIPVGLTPVISPYDFSKSLEIDSLDLDHCFEGWQDDIKVVWPDEPYKLSIGRAEPECKHVVVYTPKGQDFFCVEPVTNMTNAFNRATSDPFTGAVIIAPGNNFSRTTFFTAEPA